MHSWCTIRKPFIENQLVKILIIIIIINQRNGRLYPTKNLARRKKTQMKYYGKRRKQTNKQKKKKKKEEYLGKVTSFVLISFRVLNNLFSDNKNDLPILLFFMHVYMCFFFFCFF